MTSDFKTFVIKFFRRQAVEAIAGKNFFSRKVRTPQSGVPGNAR